MTLRPPAWAAALRLAASGEGIEREALVGAVAHHLAGAAPPDVRDWVADRWPGVARLPATVRHALPVPGAPDGPDVLGLVHEALAGARERRRGVHYTPAPLARRLAEVALAEVAEVATDPPGHDPGDRRDRSGRGGSPADQCHAAGAPEGGPPSVCDPACGGGAFLLAVARCLADRGHEPDAIVTALSGVDLDPVAARAAGTALVLWAGSVACEPTVVANDALAGEAWPGRPALGFDLVLGNPPFQAQLGSDTARTPRETSRLRERLGAAAKGYVDTAALFLLAAVDQVRPGGVVLLIQPQSVLASRDGAGVRTRLAEVAPLDGLWVCDEPVFTARTRVCAPVLRRRAAASQAADRSDGPAPRSRGDRAADPAPPVEGEHADPAARPLVRRWQGPAVTPAPPAPERSPDDTDPSSWAALAAGLRDIPTVTLVGRPLPEAAEASAGFRDQFYGLVPHVREATGAPGERPLVTSGLIDPATCDWGERSARYAKARWVAPVVDLDALAASDPALARWVSERLVPKVVVATQTRVIEAVADVEGRWVPSTPVLALPVAPERLWHLLAALLAPPASAWALRATAGTALAPDALKLSAAQLRRLPSPVDQRTWDEGARAARAAQTAATAHERVAALDRLGHTMVAAHGLAGEEADVVWRWWRSRWPRDRGPRADNGAVAQ